MELSKQRMTLLIAAMAIIGFLINTDFTSVNIALVKMAEDFSSSLLDIQWVLSGYILSWAAFALFGGKYAQAKEARSALIVGWDHTRSWRSVVYAWFIFVHSQVHTREQAGLSDWAFVSFLWFRVSNRPYFRRVLCSVLDVEIFVFC